MLWWYLHGKGCPRTCSDDGSRVLPTMAHLEAANTRAVRRRGRRRPTLHALIPYGSQRLLVAGLGLPQWAWTAEPCDLLLVLVAGCVGVVRRVVGTEQ